MSVCVCVCVCASLSVCLVDLDYCSICLFVRVCARISVRLFAHSIYERRGKGERREAKMCRGCGDKTICFVLLANLYHFIYITFIPFKLAAGPLG